MSEWTCPDCGTVVEGDPEHVRRKKSEHYNEHRQHDAVGETWL